MTKNFICANPRPYDVMESNDCTVRATSVAFNKPYLEIHKAYTEVGRHRYHGVSVHTMSKALEVITKKKQGMVRAFEEPTFAQFARLNPKGRFIVVKRKHAVALIDGVWHDAHVSQVGARCRVLFYYQVKE